MSDAPYHHTQQVHTEEHDPSSAAFQRTALALITSTTQTLSDHPGEVTAASWSSWQADSGPVVSATCVEGCVQLIAAVNAPHRAATNTAAGTAVSRPPATPPQLQATLEEQVHSGLSALNPDADVPRFEVQVRCESKGTAGSSSDAGWSTTNSGVSADGDACEVLELKAAHLDADVSGQLLYCSPPCLAAGAGTTELQLMVEVTCPCSMLPCHAVAAQGHTLPADGHAVIPGRLIVWDVNRVVLLDNNQDLTPGINLCK